MHSPGKKNQLRKEEKAKQKEEQNKENLKQKPHKGKISQENSGSRKGEEDSNKPSSPVDRKCKVIDMQNREKGALKKAKALEEEIKRKRQKEEAEERIAKQKNEEATSSPKKSEAAIVELERRWYDDDKRSLREREKQNVRGVCQENYRKEETVKPNTERTLAQWLKKSGNKAPEAEDAVAKLEEIDKIRIEKARQEVEKSAVAQEEQRLREAIVLEEDGERIHLVNEKEEAQMVHKVAEMLAKIVEYDPQDEAVSSNVVEFDVPAILNGLRQNYNINIPEPNHSLQERDRFSQSDIEEYVAFWEGYTATIVQPMQYQGSCYDHGRFQSDPFGRSFPIHFPDVHQGSWFFQ